MFESIRSPTDLARLDAAQLAQLADEIRSFLVENVAKTGGHLGPNLGAVELTLALHRVYESPRDVIVWDTGHQAYVHKIVTGRGDGFATLRQYGGLSGYPCRSESEHDWIENSHASTSLSYAAGFVEAFHHLRADRRVVAVIGDGALTGGMAYEALNQIAHRQSDLVIVLNDNGRSYSPTVGGLAAHLAQLRLDPLYRRAKRDVNEVLERVPRAGEWIAQGIHRLKGSIKELLTDPTIFDTLGMTYSGPIDGHDIEAVETALRNAREIPGPVVVHLITRKGAGYGPAEADDADHLHGVGVFDPVTGRPVPSSGRSWTAVFGDTLAECARERPDVVAVTAAMQASTGLDPMAAEFPDRVYDVGIAEQHATTFAAGLAMAGLRPVVAVYATFMNRAVDQVMMDVGLHGLPVTFVLDRAGVTGDDGPTHHGIYDMAFFRQVPGLVIGAPADSTELQGMLRLALDHDGPFMIRFSKGVASEGGAGAEALVVGRWDVARADGGVALLGVGRMVDVARKAAVLLEERGIPAAATNARFVAPLDARLAEIAAAHRLVVTVEDHSVTGGFGTGVLEALSDAGVATPVLRAGIPAGFLRQGKAARLHEEAGLTPEAIAARVAAAL